MRPRDKYPHFFCDRYPVPNNGIISAEIDDIVSSFAVHYSKEYYKFNINDKEKILDKFKSCLLHLDSLDDPQNVLDDSKRLLDSALNTGAYYDASQIFSGLFKAAYIINSRFISGFFEKKSLYRSRKDFRNPDKPAYAEENRKSGTTRIQTRLDSALVSKFEQFAKASGRTKRDVLEEAIIDILEKHSPRP